MKMKKPKKLVICKICEKIFSQSGTLNRHIDSVHNGSRNQKCPYCNAIYAYKHHLQRHVDIKHPLPDVDPEIFTCHTCAQEFSSKDHLRRHISSKHLNEISFECDTCNKRFTRKEAVQKHVLIHMKPESRRSCASTCPLCRQSFPTPPDIMQHFIIDHQLQLTTENYVFDSSDNFVSWKTSIEKQLYCAYRRRKIRPIQGGRKEVYGCHRSGYYMPRQCRKRRLKHQGSKKINGFCPSKIVLRVLSDGVHKVEFLRTHIGHPVDVEELAHVQPVQNEKRKKKTKVNDSRSGIPVPFGINISDSSSNEHEDEENCEKIDFSNRIDVSITGSACNMDLLHPVDVYLNDMVTVEAWVMANIDSVLFYKRQFEKDVSNRFSDEDFLLVFMKEAQLEKFKEYSPELVLVDGTHNVLENYPFFLHVVMVIDSHGEGYPCCFSISNRSDRIVVEIMFACIAGKIGSLTTKFFMSDIQQMYFDAWVEVTQSLPDYQLFCIWHVLDAWEVNYSKHIKSQKRRKFVRERMRKLITESDLKIFHRKLEEFLQDNDEDLQHFICYFIDNYLTNTDMWAYCYRPNVILTRDISLEKFHRELEYTRGHGYTIQYVSDALHAIDRFLNEKASDVIEAEEDESGTTYKLTSTKYEFIDVDDLKEDFVGSKEISCERIDNDDGEEQPFSLLRVDNLEIAPSIDETLVSDSKYISDKSSIVKDANTLKKQFSAVIEASVNDPRKLKYIEEMFKKLDQTLDSFDLSL